MGPLANPQPGWAGPARRRAPHPSASAFCCCSQVQGPAPSHTYPSLPPEAGNCFTDCYKAHDPSSASHAALLSLGRAQKAWREGTAFPAAQGELLRSRPALKHDVFEYPEPFTKHRPSFSLYSLCAPLGYRLDVV